MINPPTRCSYLKTIFITYKLKYNIMAYLIVRRKDDNIEWAMMNTLLGKMLHPVTHLQLQRQIIHGDYHQMTYYRRDKLQLTHQKDLKQVHLF